MIAQRTARRADAEPLARALLLAALGGCVLWPDAARAEPPEPAPSVEPQPAQPPQRAQPAQEAQATAEALFRQGRSLLARGESRAACRAFAESQRIDPSPGTLLNLGLCALQQGRLASAWASYLAAGRLARDSGRARVAAEAERRASELTPRLSHLLVTPPAQVGLRVRIDGVEHRAHSLARPLPVDPGEHVLEASAPGHRSWRKTIALHGEGRTLQVWIPPLEPAPVGRSEWIAAGPWIAMGTGAAALVAAGITGALALADERSLDDACDGALCPRRSLMATEQRGRDFATATDILIAGGGVLLGAGLVWWLLQPEQEQPQVARADCGAAGCSVRVAF